MPSWSPNVLRRETLSTASRTLPPAVSAGPGSYLGKDAVRVCGAPWVKMMEGGHKPAHCLNNQYLPAGISAFNRSTTSWIEGPEIGGGTGLSQNSRQT
jgi:hypothetical protein